MNYGLYISASGALTSLYRLDVHANNLANLNTAGFKHDFVAVRQRDAARIEDDLPFLDSNELLEKLGAGVMMGPNRVSRQQGTVLASHNPLDVAIEGEGFLVLRGGNRELLLSRDGRLTTDVQGRLVQAAEGLPVLDTSDQPIVLRRGSGSVRIDGDGLVWQDGAQVGRIQVAAISDPAGLRKAGHNTLTGDPQMIARKRPAGGVLRQGAVEQSTVEPFMTLMAVTDAERSVSANARMIQVQDELLGRVIQGLGRVT